MRTRRTWSGIFHCSMCQIEEELFADDSVECRECGELMRPGPLFADEDAESQNEPDEGSALTEGGR